MRSPSRRHGLHRPSLHSPSLLLLLLWTLATAITEAQAGPQASLTPFTPSTTPLQPQPSPAAVSLTKITTCASANNTSWIVGKNGTALVFVKVFAPAPPGSFSAVVPPVPYTASGTDDVEDTFQGGKCFEVNPTTVYYISASHTGWITLPSGGGSAGTGATGLTAPWNQADLPADKNFNVGAMNVTQSAIGFGTAATPNAEHVMVISVFGENLMSWDTNGTKTWGIAKLTGLKIPVASSIQGMAFSSKGGSSSYVWILYTDTATSMQLLRVNPNPGMKNDTVNYQDVPQNVTRLVPLSDGNGVALLGPASDGTNEGNTIVSYYRPSGPPTAQQRKIVRTEPNGLTEDQFLVSDTSILQVNPSSLAATMIDDGTPQVSGSATGPVLPQPTNSSPKRSSRNTLGVILGIAGSVVVLMALTATFVLLRRRARKNGGGGGGKGGLRSLFAKKPKDLFPAKRDETLVPLGLYHHQDRSLPELPRHLENDLQRLGYAAPNGQHGYGNSTMQQNHQPPQQPPSQHGPPYPARPSYLLNDSSSTSVDATIPIEAAMTHNRHDKIISPHSQGLSHSISISSTTSNFARRNAKSGKRFEEKIQLQVIRYETPDSYLISPHGSQGRVVLGTYAVISQARSARSIKKQGGLTPSIGRSGTVVVRRSRLEMGSSPGAGAGTAGESTTGESSMLLTEVENQHTFEVATLKWYMTEIHWKREAALLKHLKSPIFVMELLESYVIPSLQNRVHTYPFVNAMGGCSSLLSELGPVRTAQHTRSILRSISAAVEWCHRHGVVHLNIQPGSFFLEEGIDPATEDASWKLWDFTCARFIGEPVGLVGGGGGHEAVVSPHLAPGSPSSHQQQQHPLGGGQDQYAFLQQRQHEEQMDRIGGNPLPAAYTSPELLEAWRAGDTTYPAEACMDAWSLGCVYYEILTGGQPLFHTEAEAWALVGGWSNQGGWTAQDFRVPYPPPPQTLAQSTSTSTSSRQGSFGAVVEETSTAFERSQILDPSGSIGRLLQEMMTVHADERVSLETIMERIY